MNLLLKFLPVACAAALATACHTLTVHVSVEGNKVTARPDPLIIRKKDQDHNGNVTVKWVMPKAQQWLVQFANETPCAAGNLLQGGTVQETCVIQYKAMLPTKYKYYALVGATQSPDPEIDHDTGPFSPSTAPAVRVTLFCLNITGSPAPCSNGAPPQSPASPNPLTLSPADDVFWQGDSSWTIAIDTGACDQGTSLSSKNSYCTVKKTAGTCASPDPFCTYNYSVTMNNKQAGPYQLQVKKP